MGIRRMLFESGAFWGGWSAVWAYLAFHYYKVLGEYAAANYDVVYPILYVSIETWFLVSLIALMFCLYKLVEGGIS